MEGRTCRTVSIILYGALGLMALWLILKFALPWLLPFILALATARLLNPAINFLTGKFSFKRTFAAAVCSGLLLAMVTALVWVAADSLFEELTDFTARLPELTARMAPMAESLTGRLSRFLPEGWLQALTEQGDKLISGLLGKLLGFLSGCAAMAPDILLFLFTYAMSLFFMTSGYGAVTAFLLRQLPERVREKAPKIISGISGTFGKWVKAQLILMAITFLQLAAGLLILHVDYAALLSVVIAFIDALPVFGVGTVLIPWAVYSLLIGETGRAVGLAVLYGVVSLVRSCLQPRIVGSQLGLHPLATLVAMYVGYRAVGLWGMILFPVLLLFIKELNDQGYVRLWR